MTHQDLSFEFCNFVHNLINSVQTKKLDFLDDTYAIFHRVSYQRLYYALYHKILHHDSKLASSTGSNKHQAILNKIRNNPKLYQLFSKLKALRVWADYSTDDTPQQGLQSVKHLQNQVYKIIKTKKI